MSTKSLSERAKQKRNEYMRAYRKRNPEKIKQYGIRYWEKQAEIEGSDVNQGSNRK